MRACTSHDDRVKRAMARWGLQVYDLDGCRFGLVSQAAATRGKLLRKPWRIASDCDDFWRIAYKCVHHHSQHCKTQGADTKRTESYTDALADGIHLCWNRSVLDSIRST